MIKLIALAERELLDDVTRRLMLQVYLRASKLDYKTQVVSNADYMSPSGLTFFYNCFSKCDKISSHREVSFPVLAHELTSADIQ